MSDTTSSGRRLDKVAARHETPTVTRNDRYLTEAQLLGLIESGELDTVVVAFTDMQGRLQGKRLHAAYFRDHVLGHGTEGCNYLLGVDVEMNTVDGYAITSWEQGYGDMEFVLDMDTVRRLTHLPATAMIQCDLAWPDGSPVVQSPRSILQAQVDKAAEQGWDAVAGTELEFIAFRDSYEAAHLADYRGLTPVNQYNVDYSILGTTRVEPLLRRIRNVMYDAGLDVESAKGECNLGQQEIGFLFADVIATCDNHAVYKTVAKEIAAQQGTSLTFMAKWDEREGSSCHVHLSLRGKDGSLPFWDADAGDGKGARTPLYDSFVAGVLDGMSDMTLLYAPNVNSYKRFADGSFAPTAIAWGEDNRTCAVRLVGHGAGARMENRVPGADVNPYLAVAAMLACGLDGIERGLELGPPTEGNAYSAGLPTVPRTLRAAREVFTTSELARRTLGDEVVDHYTNMADVELAAFESSVTDWERRRGFERM